MYTEFSIQIIKPEIQFLHENTVCLFFCRILHFCHPFCVCLSQMRCYSPRHTHTLKQHVAAVEIKEEKAL